MLAFKMHSHSTRNRLVDKDKISEVYGEALGRFGYQSVFEDILQDLVVGSGILVSERTGLYSFGHLTFQEHLAGEYLISHAKLDDVARKLGNDWWREALLFYASLKGDITELIDFCLTGDGFAAHAQQLHELVTHAPYTSVGAVDAIKFELERPRED